MFKRGIKIKCIQLFLLIKNLLTHSPLSINIKNTHNLTISLLPIVLHSKVIGKCHKIVTGNYRYHLHPYPYDDMFNS